MDLGPTNGTITLHTGVEGAAARIGHRLTIAVQEWSAHVETAGDEPVAVTFRAAVDSLRVESGRGGATPLTPVDKQLIRRNATKTMQADRYPDVTFESGAVTVSGSTLEVSGDLTIHGVSRPLTATLDVSDRRVTGSIPVLQTEFGIKPYSQMLGQLRVRDEVRVDIDLTLPG